MQAEKWQQICREAKGTGTALAALILFWLAAGFGASHIDAEIFHLPLWVVTSTVGVWVMAIILVKLLLKYVFRDMDLEEGAQDAEHD